MTHNILAPDPWFQRNLDKNEGIFEKDVFDTILPYIKNNRIAIDVGAHCGSWSIGFSRLFKWVYAYDADPDNYSFLVRNVKENNIHNIHHKHIAVGEKDGFVNIIKGEKNSGESHIKIGTNIEMTTLDSLILDKSHIDLIKLDVEGYELRVLEGAVDILKQSRPIILLEFNGLSEKFFNIKKEETVEFLNSLGYKKILSKKKDELFGK